MPRPLETCHSFKARFRRPGKNKTGFEWLGPDFETRFQNETEFCVLILQHTQFWVVLKQMRGQNFVKRGNSRPLQCVMFLLQQRSALLAAREMEMTSPSSLSFSVSLASLLFRFLSLWKNHTPRLLGWLTHPQFQTGGLVDFCFFQGCHWFLRPLPSASAWSMDDPTHDSKCNKTQSATELWGQWQCQLIDSCICRCCNVQNHPSQGLGCRCAIGSWLTCEKKRRKKINIHFASLQTGCFSPAGTSDTHTQTSPNEVATDKR